MKEKIYLDQQRIAERYRQNAIANTASHQRYMAKKAAEEAAAAAAAAAAPPPRSRLSVSAPAFVPAVAAPAQIPALSPNDPVYNPAIHGPFGARAAQRITQRSYFPM